jgi:hypothetical protein
MNENTQTNETPEQQPWQLLDQVVRKWVALSGFEKDQENYAKMKLLHD